MKVNISSLHFHRNILPEKIFDKYNQWLPSFLSKVGDLLSHTIHGDSMLTSVKHRVRGRPF